MLTASSRDTLAVGLKRVADIPWSTSVAKKKTHMMTYFLYTHALRTTKCSVKTTSICKRAAPLLLTTSPCITRSAGVTCCLLVMIQEASIRKPLNTSTFCCFVIIPSKQIELLFTFTNLNCIILDYCIWYTQVWYLYRRDVSVYGQGQGLQSSYRPRLGSPK